MHRPAQAVMGVGRALGGMGLTRRRIAVAAGAVVLLVAGLSVILAAPAHPQAVQEGAVAALLVAAAGTAVVLVRQPGAGGPDLAALVAVGLAGAVLAGLLPQTQAYLIGYLALAGLGLRASLPTWAAIAGALAVFAGMNAAYLLVANGSITGLITQDIGLVFIFAFVRATRLAEERPGPLIGRPRYCWPSCGPVRAPAPRRWRWPSAVGWPGRSMTSWPTPCPAWSWRWTQWSC